MSLGVRSEGKRAKGQSQLDSTQEGTWLRKEEIGEGFTAETLTLN